MGRPSIFSQQIVDYICQELAKGIPLTVICRGGPELEGKWDEHDEHTRPNVMPAPRTVIDWENANTEVAASIARAREMGEFALAEECLAIADTPKEGWSEKYEKVTIPNPDDPELPDVEEFRLTERKVEDMLQHRKLQIETRLKLLAKFNPRKWGDYQRVDHDVIGTLADDLRAARERAKAG